jgi:hypothetical protein
MEFIEDSGPLLECYGEKVSFHDAEINRIELRRGRTDLGEVFLDMDLHMFAVNGVDPESGHYIFDMHCIASFQFESIQDLQLDGFNHQNAIMDLAIDSLDPSTHNGARLRVEIRPAFGVDASFSCCRCLLLKLQPGKPDGSVYP